MICPHCHHPLDGTLNPQGRLDPKDWEPCVCVACANLSTFDHAVPGGLRLPDLDDFAAWQADENLWRSIVRTQKAAQILLDKKKADHDPGP